MVSAEGNALLREGLARVIASDDDLQVAGVAADYPALIELVSTHEPDVVVTDIRVPPTGTDEGSRAAWLREHHPTIGVVVFSAPWSSSPRASRVRRRT